VSSGLCPHRIDHEHQTRKSLRPIDELRYALRGVDISNRVWRSDVLTKGTLIALDPTAFVSGFGSERGRRHLSRVPFSQHRLKIEQTFV
jgi:hypothetical protein